LLSWLTYSRNSTNLTTSPCLSASVPEAALKSGRELSAWIEAKVGKKPAAGQSAAKAVPGGASESKGEGAGGGVGAGLAGAENLGVCPACGAPVRESDKAYSCNARCGFVLWKDRLSRSGKKISPSLAARLIKGKPVPLRGLVSTKEGKGKFDAKAQLHNDPQYGWSVRLIFDEQPKTSK
jgi:hypothetical protein